MNKFNLDGLVYYCSDYVNTDVIAPGRYDPIYENDKLALIAMIDYEGIEPLVNPKLGKSEFQVILGGVDFGCGSSRETAPLALAAAGIRVIVAKSFARIFYRNCINLGEILPITFNHNFTESIHRTVAKVDVLSGLIEIENQQVPIDLEGIQFEIFKAGGLSEYFRSNGRIP